MLLLDEAKAALAENGSSFRSEEKCIWNYHSHALDGLNIGIKQILTNNAGALRLAKRQSDLLKFCHPNLCDTYALIKGTNELLIFMEWVDGQDLMYFQGELDGFYRLIAANFFSGSARTLLATYERLVGQIIAGVCNGVLELHRRQLLHRDIKPENIVICPETGVVKLIDFEMVRRVKMLHFDQRDAVSYILNSIKSNTPIDPDRTHALSHTRRYSLCGTWDFMAAEVALDCDLPYDYQADLYSIGQLTFNLLNGKSAYEIRHSRQKDQIILHSHPITMEGPWSAIAQDFVAKAMAFTPQDRFQDIQQLLNHSFLPKYDPTELVRCYLDLKNPQLYSCSLYASGPKKLKSPTPRCPNNSFFIS